jgi:hypothetical protein
LKSYDTRCIARAWTTHTSFRVAVFDVAAFGEASFVNGGGQSDLPVLRP